MKENVLEEGGSTLAKHTPYTCEPSHPHPGKDGRMHVDEYKFGAGGQKQGRASEHHTEKGWLDWGYAAKESRDKSGSGSKDGGGSGK